MCANIKCYRISTSSWVCLKDLDDEDETISDPLDVGNDIDQDPELRTPEPPVNPVDPSTARSGKRNAPAEAPVRDTNQTDGAGRGRGGERGRGRGGERRGRGRGTCHTNIWSWT